jgi:hypothetical protein
VIKGERSLKMDLSIAACVIGLISAGVVVNARLKQVPINTKRITCVEKQVVKLRAASVGTRVLNEEIVKKLYPPETASIIIRQANEISQSLEAELEVLMNQSTEPK